MPGFGIANSRLGKLNAFQEKKRNVAELANVNNPVPEKIAYVDRPKAVQEQTASLAGAADNPNPSLDKMTWKNTGIVPMAGQGQYRTEALRDMNEAEFAQNQEKMNATGKEYWIEQIKKDPLNSYAYMNYMIAEDETPEEKRKRERREALGETFRGLGNLIGNAANLYYTHRGGQYIDLNSVNEKHRARMQQIKDKQDALDEQRKKIILNAKLGEIKADRAENLADKKAKADADADDLKHKREMVKLAIQNAYKLGQIDAQTAADLLKNADKATKDAELENLRQSGRVALKGMKSGDAKANDEKVLTSLTGADGNVYTRNSKLDNVEMRELAKYIEDWSPYTTVDEDGKETIDYIGAIADAAESGLIPTEVLEQRGYKKGKSSGKKSIEGFGESNKSSNKKTISGF